MLCLKEFKELSADNQADYLFKAIKLYIKVLDIKAHGLTYIFIYRMIAGYMNCAYPCVKELYINTFNLLKEI